MKLLMYGAGSIGRGFIGPLFSFAGYEVVFADIDEGLVKLLNDAKSYHLRIMSDPPYEREVSTVRAVHALAEEAIIEEIASCDIMAVSLGPALASVAPVIARGLVLRKRRSGRALNILLCENLKDAASQMRGWLEQAFSENERDALFASKLGGTIADPSDVLSASASEKTAVNQANVPSSSTSEETVVNQANVLSSSTSEETAVGQANALSANASDEIAVNPTDALSSCGLVETVVGRMVPAAPVDASKPETLSLTVEEYGFLPINKAAFLGEIPDVPGLLPYSPFSFYEDRKLYLHNMAHSCCAYLGMLCGYDSIAKAIDDPYIFLFVKGAMTESASMLSARYGIPFETVFRHAEGLLYRFANHALGDTCARVGRDPLRKLRAEERFAGALRHCREQGIDAIYIACGLAAALLSITDDPGQARKMAAEICGLSEDVLELVMDLWGTLQIERDFTVLARMLQREKAKGSMANA